jgi:phosphoribosylformylglycinamidine synthase
MAHACRELDVPVISGNVSLYNETRGEPVYPTPVVGMLGIIEDIDRSCSMGFKHLGDAVVLLGGKEDGRDSRGGSEYLDLIHGLVAGAPWIDIDLEKRVQRCCLDLIRQGLIRSAHDCSDGGLAVALAESAISGNIGFVGQWEMAGRTDTELFGEEQSRIIVSIEAGALGQLREVASKYGVPIRELGSVGSGRFRIGSLIDLSLVEIADAWRGGLEKALL